MSGLLTNPTSQRGPQGTQHTGMALAKKRQPARGCRPPGRGAGRGRGATEPTARPPPSSPSVEPELAGVPGPFRAAAREAQPGPRGPGRGRSARGPRVPGAREARPARRPRRRHRRPPRRGPPSPGCGGGAPEGGSRAREALSRGQLHRDARPNLMPPDLHPEKQTAPLLTVQSGACNFVVEVQVINTQLTEARTVYLPYRAVTS
uniref:basic proline-rich protein-like n=1 Tax=Nyctereutes procyonoides TaxID=34880 RepID=UPI002443F977|nr:basic proline-rich protein-like [Nyctereutes procyonoides]